MFPFLLAVREPTGNLHSVPYCARRKQLLLYTHHGLSTSRTPGVWQGERLSLFLYCIYLYTYLSIYIYTSYMYTKILSVCLVSLLSRFRLPAMLMGSLNSWRLLLRPFLMDPTGTPSKPALNPHPPLSLSHPDQHRRPRSRFPLQGMVGPDWRIGAWTFFSIPAGDG